ncbi:target of Nesh-SH3 isoform X3 [Phyllopteryx taeniolatus]|uniref:target of Nesh-SH3 isoform X3 n=1 Tax=Phyllopteryx taeniolatus TaxID=161469 RepID=UPI002AD24C78|nr:target of Nesh-SH3 isoform X3 [Phyllopteryx taeniolatus]
MTRTQQRSPSFLVLFLVVLVAGIVLSGPSTPRRSRVRRQNMKVRINATGDTIVMKFVRPNADTKLEGYILGYGSSMFSKQFIPLPENGKPYETEFDAEPKYLIAVQPIPTNDVKKHCTGKVELEKPLHLVIGSVTPTSVLLSWGTLLKTPYEGNIMNDCLEDGHYTVRYRERNRKWNYQTCPTSDTVIDNLKPNAVYEFGVQPSSKDKTGSWSKPVIHNISSGGVQEKVIRKIFKRPMSPVKPQAQGPHFPFTPRHVLPNRTQGRLPLSGHITPKTTLAPTTTTRQEPLSTPGPATPATTKQPIGGGLSKSVISPIYEVPLVPNLQLPLQITAPTSSVSVPKQNGGQSQSHPPLPLNLHQPPTQSKPRPQQPQTGTKPKAHFLQHQLAFQPIPQSESYSDLELELHPVTHNPIPTHYHQTSQPTPKAQPQSETRSTPKTQTKSKTQTKPQPLSQPQTTSQPEPRHHPITQSIHPRQLTTKPADEAHPKTSQPTKRHQTQRQQIQTISHVLPKQPSQSSIEPQIQTTSESMIHFQTTFQPFTQLKNSTQARPSTKKQFKVQSTLKPRTHSLIPMTQPLFKKTARPETQSQPKTQPGQPAKSQNQPITGQHNINQPQPLGRAPPQPQSHPLSDTLPQRKPASKFPSTAQSLPQSEPRTKANPASTSQAELQPGIEILPQGRIHSGPVEVPPLQAVPTAPSPREKGKPLPIPAPAAEKPDNYNLGTTNRRVETPRPPTSSSAIPAGRNTTFSRIKPPPQSPRNGVRSFSTSSHSSRISGAHHRSNALPKPGAWSKEKPVLRQSVPVNKRPNLVGMPNDHDKPMDLKQGDKESILKPFPLVTSKPKQDRRQQTATTTPSLNSSRFDINENSSIFRPLPASDVDIMGKKRYVAPHVIYKTDKKPDEPCSITSSLAYFPDDEDGGDQNVTAAPRIPPSNLTVVTVEGCPSFVILDWQKSDNETREYEVVSTAKGPNGEEVSILTTTNQTHTAVENLKPESSYEFKVTPKNELGTGPSSEPVSFNTESADPRVSENVSGKDAIWTQFPFKTDAYSECNGKQYVKRTWYRKFVGIQLCNSLRYKIYLSDSLNGKFYNIGDQSGHGEDHCQFVDSFLDGRTGTQLFADQLPSRPGYLRALRQEPVSFGEIGGKSHVTYVGWYECGTPIPGKW